MSHHPVTLTPPIADRTAAKFYPGFGILGADIPTTGDNGGSPVLNDGINPASEYHWRLITPPASGIFTIYRDLSCDYDSTGAANGDYTAVYELFEGAGSVGTALIRLHVGPYFVAGANSQQSNQADAAAIRQTHLIGAANSQQVNTGVAASISQSSITFVSAANAIQINQATAASIRQTHLIGAASSQQVNAASAAAIAQTAPGSLLIAHSQQINQASAASIRQTHRIGVAHIQQVNRASAGRVSDGTQPIGATVASLVASVRAATRLGVAVSPVNALLREVDLSNFYYKGGSVRLHVRVAGDGDADFDPAVLTLKTRFDSGQVTVLTYGIDPEIVRDRIGRYHADLDLLGAGTFHFRWETTAPAGAAEGKIPVAAGRFS